MQNDHVLLEDAACASLSAGARADDTVSVRGRFGLECVGADGTVLWRDEISNLVVTAGKNELLTNGLSSTAYMFPISSASFSTIVAADTMGSHAGWVECAGTVAPAYSGTRPALSFAAASGGSRATSAAAPFVFTNSGTVQAFGIVFGSGASSTQGNTSGVLLSGGTLAAARAVQSGDTLNATYTLGM